MPKVQKKVNKDKPGEDLHKAMDKVSISKKKLVKKKSSQNSESEISNRPLRDGKL